MLGMFPKTDKRPSIDNSACPAYKPLEDRPGQSFTDLIIVGCAGKLFVSYFMKSLLLRL